MASVFGEKSYNIQSLLASKEDRDFLIRNNGDQVKISSLDAKTFGLYFSASWCGPCRRFTPKLIELYNELLSKDEGFEVIFISGDKNEESFKEYFAKMPWLAIPFADSNSREQLNKLFKVQGIPHLVILNSSGEVLNDDGVDAVSMYGSDGFPFTVEKINKLKEDEEAAKKQQNIRSLLVSPSRDYLISNTGAKVSVSDLEGKIVAIYFSVASYRPCAEFTILLQQIYEKIKKQEEKFEIVLISLDDDESSFKESFSRMPWLALPFKDKLCEKLPHYFELQTIPYVVILGVDGKTLKVKFSEIVEEHGLDAWQAFPFSQDKLNFLAEKAKAKRDAQTLESLLVSGELDYVINKGGEKVPVSGLVGKNILLYFSAQWCGPCRAFLPKLIEEYHKIKSKDDAFEVIFISSDRDQSSFDDFYSGMPWLALPLGDERKKLLSNIFKIRGIPSLVAIDSKGRTVTTNARGLLVSHGAEAYPFNEERIKELENKIEEMAKSWPEKIKHKLHEEHELVLTRCSNYGCDGCQEAGNNWSYRCIECDFDLHPACALKEDADSEKDGDDHGNTEGEGYVCDGEVCRKV